MHAQHDRHRGWNPFWAALGAALLGFLLPGRKGSVLAVVALLFALPALVLYTASLAVFALVIAALRLVRAPRSV